MIASERDTDTQSTRDNPLNQDTQDPTPTFIPTHTLTPDQPTHLPRIQKIKLSKLTPINTMLVPRKSVREGVEWES